MQAIYIEGNVTRSNDPLYFRGNDPITKMCPVADFAATVTRWTGMGRYIRRVETVNVDELTLVRI